MDPRMRRQKCRHLLGLVRREVIDDDVDPAPTRLGSHDVGQEVDKGVAGVPDTVWPMISPVLVFSAAYNERVLTSAAFCSNAGSSESR
jgi:hypothetical protein